ncbi:MAG: MFS transporter [Thermaceae bacterium]|nr:MFS transporter [Thermaceae bacterium]
MTSSSGSSRLLRFFPLSAYWFGFSFHWFLLLPILMPADVQRFVGEANKGAYLGWLAGTLALVPLLLPPFIGMWSDRLGQRMPFLLWGTAINILGLLVMLLAPGYWVYAVGYFLVQLGNSLASSPYTALIPDVVPQEQRGAASGAMGFFQLTSQIAGGLAAFALGGNREGQFLAIIVVLAVVTLITVRFVREPGVPRDSQSQLDLRIYFQRQYYNFRWVFLTRAFVESGRFAVQPFLLFYLRDVIGTFQLGPLKIPSASLALAAVLMLLSVTAALTAILAGRLSDKVGKKPVIYFAGAFTALAALGFALTHSFVLAVVVALVFGLGYGAYISVDWALATSVLPDETKHARDMGIWHVALVFPQLFQGLFGQVLDAGNRATPNGGYPLLFAIAVTFFLLGTLFVSRVRGVR